jgi:hypothetical protein
MLQPIKVSQVSHEGSVARFSAADEPQELHHWQELRFRNVRVCMISLSPLMSYPTSVLSFRFMWILIVVRYHSDNEMRHADTDTVDKNHLNHQIHNGINRIESGRRHSTGLF